MEGAGDARGMPAGVADPVIVFGTVLAQASPRPSGCLRGCVPGVLLPAERAELVRNGRETEFGGFHSGPAGKAG